MTMLSNTTSLTLITTSAELELSTEDEKNVPVLYISSDDRLSPLLAFRVAIWVDYIYVPLCACLGILGNLLSFCVLLSPRLSGASTSVYMAALSVSDTLVQVSNVLFLAQKFPGHEVLRQGTCGLISFLFLFAIHYNVMVMMGMTLERYVAIRFPLKASRWCTPRRARVAVVIICILAVSINLHNLIIRKMVWNDVMKTEACSTEGPMNQFFLFKIWPWIDSAVYCYVPLLTVTVLNVLIVRQMRSSQKFRSTSTSVDQSDVSRQVTRMLLLVTCMFLVLVGPMGIMLVVERYVWVRTTLHQQAVFHLIRTLLNNLDYTNHAINFCLYCLSGKRFREEFFRIFLSCSSADESTTKSKSASQPDPRTSNPSVPNTSPVFFVVTNNT